MIDAFFSRPRLRLTDWRLPSLVPVVAGNLLRRSLAEMDGFDRFRIRSAAVPLLDHLRRIFARVHNDSTGIRRHCERIKRLLAVPLLPLLAVFDRTPTSPAMRAACY